jgi:hypothetical protein
MDQVRKRRRRAWITGIVLLVLLVAILSAAIMRFQFGTIPQSSFDQNKNGMTLTEVEALLGTPTRKVSNPTQAVPMFAAIVAEWRCGGSVVILGFDDAERLQSKIYRQRTALEALGDQFEALTGWN